MAHVEDRWKREGRRGTGRRWRVRYAGPDGRERSRSFDRKIDAEQLQGGPAVRSPRPAGPRNPSTQEDGTMNETVTETSTPAAEAREIVLGQVLADAIFYREPSGDCDDCDQHPAGLCEPHAADLDRCDDYLWLARELGVEVDR